MNAPGRYRVEIRCERIADSLGREQRHYPTFFELRLTLRKSATRAELAEEVHRAFGELMAMDREIFGPFDPREHPIPTKEDPP